MSPQPDVFHPRDFIWVYVQNQTLADWSKIRSVMTYSLRSFGSVIVAVCGNVTNEQQYFYQSVSWVDDDWGYWRSLYRWVSPVDPPSSLYPLSDLLDDLHLHRLMHTQVSGCLGVCAICQIPLQAHPIILPPRAAW